MNPTEIPAFPFGLASGDVTEDSIVLWTRVAPGTPVEWHCEEAADVATHRSGTVLSDARTGSVHVGLDALAEGRQYRYWFSVGGDRSGDGLFRTVPLDRAVRLAVVSCAKFNSGFFGAYRAIAQRDDIDFVLHLGDYIYEAGDVPRGHQTPGANIGRSMNPLHDCVSLEDYEARYAQYRADPDLQLLHSRHAIIATIDDHELSDNAWLGGADEHDVERDGSWTARRAAAMTAWGDWMPSLRTPLGDLPLWREISLGTAGRILLCEARLARTDPHGDDGPAKSALGLTQRQFLLDRLAVEHEGWTIVAMPSMLSSVDEAMHDQDALFALRKLKMVAPDSDTPFTDRWGSFTYERDLVVDTIAGAGAQTVVFSGDVHFAAEHSAERRTGRFTEWTTTSLTSPNLDDKLGWEPNTKSRDYEGILRALLPEMEWCDLDRHGYLIGDFGPDGASCEWWFLDNVRDAASSAYLGRRSELSTAVRTA